MARQRKPAPQAAKTMQVRYPDEGSIEEMRGRWYDVPATVADKRGWLESQYREEMARALADQEKAEREQQVLNDYIAQQQRLGEQLPSRVDALELENAELRAELQQVQTQLAHLDETKLLEINQNAELMGRSYDMGQQVMAQTETTRQLQQSNAESLERWAELKQQTLDVSRNQLDFWNQAQAAAGQIQQREDQIALEQERRKLTEQIGENWELVDAARKLNATSVKKQNEAFKAAVTKTQNQLTEEFVEMLNLGLTALGLTEADLNMAAQNIEMNPAKPFSWTSRRSATSPR